MKVFAIVGVSCVAASVSAQTFTQVAYSDNLGSSATFTSSGLTYTANLTGFNLNPTSAFGDVAWIFNFDSNPFPAFSAVTVTVTGTLTNGSLTIFGNEKVFDRSGPTMVEVANGLLNQTANSDPSGTFTITETFTFTQPVTLGQAQKDFLHILAGPGANASVTSISQTFTPVPEPASMVALGLGLGWMARRRRRNS